MSGLETVVELCLASDHLETVHAAAMAISTVVPTAEARYEAQSEGVALQVQALCSELVGLPSERSQNLLARGQRV